MYQVHSYPELKFTNIFILSEQKKKKIVPPNYSIAFVQIVFYGWLNIVLFK